MDLTSFKDILETQIYTHTFSEEAILDAFNYRKEYDDGSCFINICGVRLWFDNLGNLTETCFKLNPPNFSQQIGTRNHKLEIEMREKGVYYG